MQSLKNIVELIPQKFYWAESKEKVTVTSKIYFINFDTALVYEPFAKDFGPLHLGHVQKQCTRMEQIMNDEKFKDFKIVHWCSTSQDKRANAAFLACAYMVIIKKQKPLEVCEKFTKIHPGLTPFRDANMGECRQECRLEDAVCGLWQAARLGWQNQGSFDLNFHMKQQEVENGDMNWIIPQRFLAFMGPEDNLPPNRYQIRLWGTHDQAVFFKRLNFAAVFRLNKNTTYNKNKFTQNQIEHQDMQFPDGYPPDDRILARFLEAAEKQDKPMGVHCKAGLGRTGCCIAGQAIKHFRFPARWFIGQIRVCRPGSILGPQQHWMLQEEEKLLRQGEEWRARGRRIQLHPSWLQDGDTAFIKELVEGKFDKSDSKSVRSEEVTEAMSRIKLVENAEIEEQGNRLVNSKTKSPSMSPKKILDPGSRFGPVTKFSNNTFSNNTSSPVKNVKMTNLKNF